MPSHAPLRRPGRRSQGRSHVGGLHAGACDQRTAELEAPALEFLRQGSFGGCGDRCAGSSGTDASDGPATEEAPDQLGAPFILRRDLPRDPGAGHGERWLQMATHLAFPDRAQQGPHNPLPGCLNRNLEKSERFRRTTNASVGQLHQPRIVATRSHIQFSMSICCNSRCTLTT